MRSRARSWVTSGETDGSGAGARGFHGPGWEMLQADCREVLPVLPSGVFDACVTDPPYGLGKLAWDADVPGSDIWREVLRVLKPGAALVAFAGRRTYHRLAIAVEDAGFRVVDQAVWVFRTGRRPSDSHLRPAHELVMIARAPGVRAFTMNRSSRSRWAEIRTLRARCLLHVPSALALVSG